MRNQGASFGPQPSTLFTYVFLLSTASTCAGVETSDFARKQYWDDNYKDGSYGDKYDWYVGWSAFYSVLEKAGVNRTDSILHVGCGNSEIVEELWSNGYQRVTHLDLSDVIIGQMSTRLNFTNHSFMVGDMTALAFADRSFDVVLDKGVLDAILSGGKKLGRKAVREVARVLKPVSGRYVLVSMAGPQRRLRDVQTPHESLSHVPAADEIPTFSCQTDELKKENSVRYAYICHKPSGTREVSQSAAHQGPTEEL